MASQIFIKRKGKKDLLIYLLRYCYCKWGKWWLFTIVDDSAPRRGKLFAPTYEQNCRKGMASDDYSSLGLSTPCASHLNRTAAQEAVSNPPAGKRRNQKKWAQNWGCAHGFTHKFKNKFILPLTISLLFGLCSLLLLWAIWARNCLPDFSDIVQEKFP